MLDSLYTISEDRFINLYKECKQSMEGFYPKEFNNSKFCTDLKTILQKLLNTNSTSAVIKIELTKQGRTSYFDNVKILKVDYDSKSINLYKNFVSEFMDFNKPFVTGGLIQIHTILNKMLNIRTDVNIFYITLLKITNSYPPMVFIERDYEFAEHLANNKLRQELSIAQAKNKELERYIEDLKQNLKTKYEKDITEIKQEHKKNIEELLEKYSGSSARRRNMMKHKYLK